MTAMQAGLLSRLTQVEKAVQGHDDTNPLPGRQRKDMRMFLIQEFHRRHHRMCSMLPP